VVVVEPVGTVGDQGPAREQPGDDRCCRRPEAAAVRYPVGAGEGERRVPFAELGQRTVHGADHEV
jgi:hypothetical protein